MNQLYLLGTGTPTPTPNTFGTAYVLRLGEEYLMFDCGPAATHKLVKAGLWPTAVNHLFFTHHHFDHDADYPCFLLCRWDQSTGREEALNVWGPPPTKLMTERLIGPEGAFVQDWQARVGAPVSQHVHRNRGGSLPRPEPRVEVHDIGPGPVVSTGSWEVSAAAVHHVEPWLISLAYRVQAPGLTITFAGDTGPCDSLNEVARGSDVLVVNCWDHQDTMDDNGEGPGQTGTRDAALMANEAQARMLVLTHTGKRMTAPGLREKAIGDIRTLYDGTIVFGEELLCLDLS